ncbi:Avirulence (Avh) protein [Phytophthora megakarya]|uniref:RxLR effector protein n=1 Tax=Phytophthora megakarya TaxID=4795 RepID=A0A225WKG3_9STRA|nr:Avirulence (Avh) protein [Phytophthora megakarya]
MRVQFLVTGTVIALLAVVEAHSASKTSGKHVNLADTHHKSDTISDKSNVFQSRLLRQHDDGNNGDIEERGPLNLDHLIEDGVHAIRMNTKWKAQFATWKFFGKEPNKVGKELGVITESGIIRTDHTKWAKYKAYVEYYDKGPLRYP